MQKADNNTTVVYSKPNCTYCVKAKHLLKNKGVEFIEMLIWHRYFTTTVNGRV